jgi:hypothetical protein
MERGVPRRRRPRPVASAGVEALLLRGEELAKGWLLALVEDAPLEQAAAILAGEIARDGPRICDAAVRAIQDEADLRRIEREGVLEPLASRTGELAGAESAETAAHAVEALKDVVWSALWSELSREEPELLVDAAERLSLVVDVVRGAVLRRRDESDARGGAAAGRVAPLRVASAPPPPGSVGEHDRRGAGGAAGLSREGGVWPGFEGAQDSAQAAGGATAGTRFTGIGAAGGEQEEEPGERAEPERDALCIGALRDEIVRAARARVPLSLLLVELEDAEKMLAVEPCAQASVTFGRFAQAVRGSVRRRDVLACETESRAWIIARDTGRAAPLTLSVGVAVLGEDGNNALELIDAAEQMRFAAEASGIGIVRGGPGNGGEEPPTTGPDLAG